MKQIYVLTTILLLTCINLIAQTTDVVTGLSIPQGMVLNGNDLYIAEVTGSKISKIDITDATPTAIDVVTGLNKPRQLLLNGNDLYIAEEGGNKISKIDITDATPIAIDVVTDLSNPQGMVLNGNDLYIAESTGSKISKIDITDAIPTAIDVVTDLSNPRQLVLSGNDLYIAELTGNKISKIDITDTTPTTTDVVTANFPNFIMLAGNEIYIAEEGASKISKFDITDTTPTTTDIVTNLGIPAGIALKDNTLYISLILQNKIVSTQITLSLNENLFTEKIRMFPNPSSDFIQFSGLTKKVNYKIFNTQGSIIQNGTTSNQEEIDIRSLTNGLYFLKFDSGNTLKFLKE